MYIGGNIEQFVPGGPKLSVDLFSGAARAAKIEGTLTFGAADFTFETGRAGSLTIPYNAVEHVEYGIRTSPRAGGVVHFIPWNPYEQVTKKAHGLLTIVLKHQDGPHARPCPRAWRGAGEAGSRSARTTHGNPDYLSRGRGVRSVSQRRSV